jgi:hypothetical protein
VTPQASLEQQLGQQPALVPGPARQLDLDILSVLSNRNRVL